MIMGLPGAGKSTAARAFVEQGYARLNRDEDGGSLRDLLPALDRRARVRLLAHRSRQHLRVTKVARVAHSSGGEARPSRTLRLALDECRGRAGERGIEDGARFGRLLGPAEMRQTARTTSARSARRCSSAISASSSRPTRRKASHASRRSRFERTRDASFTNRALIVWCDGILGSRLTSSLASATSRCLRIGEKSCVDTARRVGVCWACRGSPRLPRRCSPPSRWRPASRGCRNGSASAIDVALLSSRRRAAGLLVPEAAARPRRRLRPAASARSVALHLCRRRSAGPGVRAPARFSVPRRQ